MPEKQEGSRSGPPTAGQPMNIEAPMVEELFAPLERLLDRWQERPQPKGAGGDGRKLTAVSVTNRLNKLFLTVIDTPGAEKLEAILDKELESLEEIRHELGKVRDHVLRERNALEEAGIEIVGFLRLLENLETHIYSKIVARFAVAVRRTRELSQNLEIDDGR